MPHSESLQPAVFLDRDGTLMEEVHYCRDPKLVRLLPGVQSGLQQLHTAGFQLVIITNQSGIGRGLIALEEYHAVHARMIELLPAGLITATYFCADHPDSPSTRRKPAPGMLLEAAAEHRLDLAKSWMVGDKQADVECGHAAGARSILVQTGYGVGQANTSAEYVAPDFPAATRHILSSASR